MGLPDPLASSARDALWAIATTGAPKDDGEDWTLFGEVLGHSTGPPFCVSLRRVSLLMTSDAMPSGAQWEHFDLICPVEHKRVDFAPGMLIGIHTKSVNRSEPCKVVADESVPVWNISSFDRCLAWNVTHLFAGAYEGWLRSMWWAQQANLGLSFATHTSADWCPEVMKTWGYNHGRPVQQCPIPVTYNPVESINGILADISDLTLLRASANKSNLLMTLSPPCPSWSRGGKHSGLATDEGFCFLDAIEHVARVRPVLALFECSDGIEGHPHWRVLSAAMQLAGYSKVWSQDVAIHQITSNFRTRWIAVWVRHDIPCKKHGERFLCPTDRRINWDDVKHQHSLPTSLAADLILQAPQLQVYGDRVLLPVAKRSRDGSDMTMQQVLTQRLVQRGEVLPTLCASYTAQHLLQRDHLEAKGLFASLTQQEGKFCFIDPFTFVTLFGTTDSVALPTVLRKAFHQLGNAISQLHGLIGLLVGLESVTGESFHKQALVQQCWEDRLTAENAIIRVCDDMYVLQPVADFVAKALPSIVTWQPWLFKHTLIRFCDDATLVPLNIDENLGVIDQLLLSLDLGKHHAHSDRALGDEGALPSDVIWSDIPAHHLQVKIGSYNLCTLQVLHTSTTDPIDDPIVSPTQPWLAKETDLGLDQLQDAQQAGFLHVAEYLCQDAAPRHIAKILLLQQDGTSEWINDANLDRVGSIPVFQHGEKSLHFFKVNREACQQLLAIHIVMAIQGTYEPVHPDKWILLAGGSELRWCKICQIPRTLTPRQCDMLLGQQCHITMRNTVVCRADEPLMLINADVLWSDIRVHDVVPIAFGGMDRLSENPSSNVSNDDVVARLLQFNLEPGAVAVDEVIFHFDILQVLMPSICWCSPGSWVSTESQFRLPTQPVDLQRRYQHFVVPILVVFDWIFVEVRFFEGQWRVLYHSPEQLTIRQTNAVLELINVMGIPVAPNAYRWIRTTEDNDLAPWHTLRTFYARAGAPLLPESHRSLQRLQRTQHTQHIMQILDQADLVWRDTQAEDRMVQLARACRQAFLMAIMESPSRAEDLLRRATGRPLPVYDIREIFFIADEWLEMRLNIYRTPRLGHQ